MCVNERASEQAIEMNRDGRKVNQIQREIAEKEMKRNCVFAMCVYLQSQRVNNWVLRSLCESKKRQILKESEAAKM